MLGDIKELWYIRKSSLIEGIINFKNVYSLPTKKYFICVYKTKVYAQWYKKFLNKITDRDDKIIHILKEIEL